MFIENVTSISYSSEIQVRKTEYGPTYYPNPKHVNDGIIRVNINRLEYYNSDEDTWTPLIGDKVDLNMKLPAGLDVVINWAYEKMNEERKIEQLAAKYPALKQARDNFELIKQVVKNEEI